MAKKNYIFSRVIKGLDEKLVKVKPQMNINDIDLPCKEQEFEKSIFNN